MQVADDPSLIDVDDRDVPAGTVDHRTIPASGARPVYRAYDVGVEFNESYVEPMYILSGTPLQTLRRSRVDPLLIA